MTIKNAQDVRTKIQMAFMEMPEMQLTRGQVRRLLDLPADSCERALAALVHSGFLTESLDGAFIRAAAASAAALGRFESRAM
jgi:hypothetical protein